MGFSGNAAALVEARTAAIRVAQLVRRHRLNMLSPQKSYSVRAFYYRPRAGVRKVGSVPPRNNEFADHRSGLELRVRGAQVCSVDRAQRFAERAANLARIDQLPDAREQPVLLDHVRGLEPRAREHQLPGDGCAF